MKKILTLLFAFLLLPFALPLANAATGCNFPASLDAWADKASPDQITYADFNARTCAIEKLEDGIFATIKGGTTPSSTLALRSTTGVGTSDAILFQVGNNGATEAGRFTTGGFLALGTTVVTGADVGSVIVPNVTSFRSVNGAGTNTVALIRATALDQVHIAPGGADIRWGPALIALGGGAAPTLGTIGGSGPGTPGQNSWMRVIDSSNVAFWIPVWK